MLFVTSVDEDFFALHQRRTASSSALLAIIRPDYYVCCPDIRYIIHSMTGTHIFHIIDLQPFKNEASHQRSL